MIEFREEPEPLLVMRYYPRGNLQDVWGSDASAATAIDDGEYASAFRQVLLGLSFLHSHRVVHRDLKPENLLVEAPFTIKISDFGLSKVERSTSPLKTFCGSLLYVAPEVYPVGGSSRRGGGGYTASADIWSAGVVMLGFRYGHPPCPDEACGELEWGRRWCDRLERAVNDWEEEEDDGVIGILVHMVKKEAYWRLTADECLERGCANGLFRRKRVTGAIVDRDDDDSDDDGRTTPTQESTLGGVPGDGNLKKIKVDSDPRDSEEPARKKNVARDAGPDEINMSTVSFGPKDEDITESQVLRETSPIIVAPITEVSIEYLWCRLPAINNPTYTSLYTCIYIHIYLQKTVHLRRRTRPRITPRRRRAPLPSVRPVDLPQGPRRRLGTQQGRVPARAQARAARVQGDVPPPRRQAGDVDRARARGADCAGVGA